MPQTAARSPDVVRLGRAVVAYFGAYGLTSVVILCAGLCAGSASAVAGLCAWCGLAFIVPRVRGILPPKLAKEREHEVMIFDGFSHQLPDTDPDETEEWVDSFESVIEARGKNRARFLLMKLLERARESQVGFPATVSTPYVNTIPADQEPWFPGNEHLERRVRAYIRWNAAVMVTRANMRSEGIGGHLATYASSASLYEVGFNHFFHGKSNGHHGDQVFFQGHASPGIYARAFLEGRLSEAQLDGFRCEVDGGGLSSYPHPRLMPELW
jgi:pyruvate dehydrogenase E1 component